MHIKMFKLNNGETLITEIESVKENALIIRNPIELFARPTKNGTTVVAQQWIPLVYEDTLATMSMQSIISSINPQTDMINFYLDAMENFYRPLPEPDDAMTSEQIENEIIKLFGEFEANTSIQVH